VATNNNQPVLLTGTAAQDASLPMAQTPRGGMEFGFDGSSGMAPSNQQPQEQSPFAGLGPFLEEPDAKVFDTVHQLVLRQELIALNHLAQDTHWTRVKLGYPWSTLEKLPNQDVYKCSLPYGASAITIQAIPNKSWDLCNKAAETLLVDFPQPDAVALNDSEEAERAAEMADKFLDQDGGENGTNDNKLFYQAVDGSLTCSSKYIHAWVDPSGGGYVPLQIKAHPLAESPDNPLVGPDGMPTTDYILRYVTKDNQFTENPLEAAPQWQPKIRGEIWGREHIRVYPESADVSNAEKIIGLYYCTLGEAKRRWQSVANMTPEQLSALCDWTPVRYLVLLPPFQRARWKLTNGSEKERSGSSDERIMFYYIVYQRATPEYPKGAELVVTGALDKLIIHKNVLASEVQVTGHDGTGPKPEIRCMDIPVIQVTPRQDPDERDPSGRAYIELFGGSTEFQATLAMGYMEVMDQIIHTEAYIPSTSSVEGWQRQEARASGDMIAILRKEDAPIYGNTPPVPTNFLDVMNWSDQKTDSIASLNKPVQGSDNQQEVSGKARQIAVQQAMVGLNRMQNAVNSAAERWWRVKIQLAMRDFKTPQLIRYTGEDGAYKEAEWTGTDFALVGDVGIKSGTGTMMTPEGKVQYVGNLRAVGLIGPDEAAEVARPTFAETLGVPDNPHQQYIERCVAIWLQGPPPGWTEMYQVYQQGMAEYEAINGPIKQQYEMQAQAAQQQGLPAPPPPQLEPPPQAPWSPFEPRVNDDDPDIAVLWKRRLSKVISSVRYSAMDPMWRQILDQKYLAARDVVAQSMMAQAQPSVTGQPPQEEQKPQPQGVAG